MSFGEKDSSIMMQFLHNRYPLDQTYLESREYGCHDGCGLATSCEDENMLNRVYALLE